MSPSDPAAHEGSPTLGAELEARRLDHRARRMAMAVAELRQRADSYQARGSVPRPLQEAILGFSRQLRADRERLRALQAPHPRGTARPQPLPLPR